MNVSGVGGAASLPMILPSSTSSSVAAGTGATSTATSTATTAAGTSPTGSGTTSTNRTGEVRLPGQQRTQPTESANRTEKEAPKPAPLPPLKGLTVAEIRAMLGVAPLPGQDVTGTSGAIGGAAAALAAPSRTTTAFLQRYA